MRTDGGKGAQGMMAFREGWLRGTAARRCCPCSSFPLLIAALQGGREGTVVHSHLWGKCSTDKTLDPALIYLLGAWDSSCSHLLELGTFAELCMGVSMAEDHGEWVSDGSAACQYHHNGYNHLLLHFSSTERHDHHRY